MRPIPAFLAFPHSEACSDTSMPVGSNPRNAAITNHDPSGTSTMKKWPKAETGAGSARYTGYARDQQHGGKQLGAQLECRVLADEDNRHGHDAQCHPVDLDRQPKSEKLDTDVIHDGRRGREAARPGRWRTVAAS